MIGEGSGGLLLPFLEQLESGYSFVVDGDKRLNKTLNLQDGCSTN